MQYFSILSFSLNLLFYNGLAVYEATVWIAEGVQGPVQWSTLEHWELTHKLDEWLHWIPGTASEVSVWPLEEDLSLRKTHHPPCGETQWLIFIWIMMICQQFECSCVILNKLPFFVFKFIIFILMIYFLILYSCSEINDTNLLTLNMQIFIYRTKQKMMKVVLLEVKGS